MSNKAPTYDPQLAAEQRAQRAYDALKDAIKFGTALVLPNREAGFAQGLVTQVKTHKQIEQKRD